MTRRDRGGGGVLLSEALRVSIEALRVCRGSESVYTWKVASIAIIKLYYTCTLYINSQLDTFASYLRMYNLITKY